eukprot:TRINITY_DN5412_c0_g3_i1.p1 TRINITY_DN5412_c0_g3~~TRINITY_DN5412_c0_g3_i1.p1  ORF type:complete len:549 (-),score=53.09 TRINITY_DN5412_c0_g3_i1:226-1872(-)
MSEAHYRAEVAQPSRAVIRCRAMVHSLGEETHPSSDFARILQQLKLAHEAEILALRHQCDALRQSSSPPSTSPGLEQRGSADQTTEQVHALRQSDPSDSVEPRDLASQTRDAAVVAATPHHSPLEDSRSKAKADDLIRTIGLKFASQHPILGNSFRDTLRNIVLLPCFEISFGVLIIVNSMFMALEVQLAGYEIGYDLKVRWHERSASEQFGSLITLLEISSWVFGILFAIECFMKIAASCRMFSRDIWNWFDLVVVLLWIFSRLRTNILPMNPTFLRIARLARLLRLLRIVRRIQGFDALYVMTTAMRNCVSTLFWTFVFLFLVEMMIALFMSQFLHEFYFKDATPIEDQEIIFTYFGTFLRSFFTMFEITLGNWPPVCRILGQRISEWFLLLGVVHKLSIGFAVVAIINGVFMQETFTVSAMDDVLMVRRKELQTKHHVRKMHALWRAVESGGDGMISRDEWKSFLTHPVVKTWLGSMELDARDAELAFSLLDESGDDQLSFTELVQGVSKLKGAAKSIDLHALWRENLKIQELLGCHQSHDSYAV